MADVIKPTDEHPMPTGDHVQSLRATAEKGATTPPGSDDKQAKGIMPAADPAQRIDEMTNTEAKAFSADLAGGNAHVSDEDRPAGRHDRIDPASGKRTPAEEDSYRQIYAKGWNQFNSGQDERTAMRDRNASIFEKDAYLAGWQGAERESNLGHSGGDMKSGEVEAVRVGSAKAP